ncbi:MAG: 4-(cytidine 5'-diphospho)-2-C-methyl-D-erythritol kinase [Clostridia bacterium]|nr:4-(cytidine 5'-diphospho)-2-C-methyl-D-erythritol kinase [Clostridia bacterium]
MHSLTTQAYAKINLFLDVLDTRADGYHNIKSIMQQVSLADTVTVTKKDASNGITVSCTDPAVPTDERNIVYKCAVRFFDHFGITDCGIHIHIEKNIPLCGGLAGGSTDGAAVLKLLNELYDVHASTETLCEIGVKVGADVPFCVVGGTCICEGIGEILTPVNLSMLGYKVLISFPGEGISTPVAYKALDTLPRPATHATAEDVLDSITSGITPREMYNAFELAVLPDHEKARFVKDTMIKSGAVSSMMSGSGSTIFGLFEDDSALNTAVASLSSAGFGSHICHPIN